MCLILFALKTHRDYPLVLAANRDEAYMRPTAPAAFWADHPDIYGGRDLELGGTWLGMHRGGAIAAVTNYRDASRQKSAARSRGELPADYLRGRSGAADYLARLQSCGDMYNGFNLLAGTIEELHYLSNRGERAAPVAPGVHGLSNHLLDTPWPKVERGKRGVTELLQSTAQPLIDGLFKLLAERAIAADDALPATGIGMARERVLSPAFIAAPSYGTRSSTVILIDNHGDVEFIERSFSEYGSSAGNTSARFALESPTYTGDALRSDSRILR